MRTVFIFTNNRNLAVRIPKDLEFEGVSELEISREWDTMLLRPVRPSWRSLRDIPGADADFLTDRPSVVDEDCFLSGLK